jgi:hypothetical protein
MNITSNQSEQFGQVGPSKNSQFIVVFGNLKHKLARSWVQWQFESRLLKP